MGAGGGSTALAASAVVLAGHAAPGLCAWSPALRGALGVADRIADHRAVALTFDDGPHPQGTPATLAVLASARARATFFLAAEQVGRDPALVAEIAAAGHAIGVHCHRHRNLLRLAPGQVGDDLRRAESVIAHAAGHAPRLYRPPYGILTTAALAHARRRGWTTVLWSRWGRDWRARATAPDIAARAADGLAGGEIVLLHDADHYAAAGSWRATVSALPAILDRVADAGLRCAAISPAAPMVPVKIAGVG